MSLIHKRMLEIERMRTQRNIMLDQYNKMQAEIQSLNLTIGYKVEELESAIIREFGKENKNDGRIHN